MTSAEPTARCRARGAASRTAAVGGAEEDSRLGGHAVTTISAVALSALSA